MGDYGIIINLALGDTSHGNPYGREPDFGDYPRRQERRCHPCSRINVCTFLWFDLLLLGNTAAKMRFSVHGTKRTDWVGVMSVDWGRVEAVGGAPNRRSSSCGTIRNKWQP